MEKCENLNCSKEFTSVAGKRKRKTCSNSCRVQFYQQRKKESKLSKVVTVAREDWERYEQWARTNPLINAAKGRDEGGVNLDEIRESKLTSLANQDTEKSLDGVGANINFIDEARQLEAPEEEITYPKEYNRWIKMAKEGVTDLQAFKSAVAASNLNANQKAMVLSKIL